MQVRSRPEVERFFGGVGLIEPGVVSLPRWRPDNEVEVGEADLQPDAAVSVYGGVAREPWLRRPERVL